MPGAARRCAVATATSTTTTTNFEDLLAGGTSLREVLSGQLAVDIDDPAERLIGHYLIDLLDDTGYLSADLAGAAEALGCSLAQVEATLAKLQTFEPAGIFARSLAECLGLQLEDRGRLDEPMQALLDHLDLLARRDWAGLARVCGVGHDQILKMAAEIRTLSPKPALAFDHVVSQPVVPDVMMRPQPNGGWVVELNSETLPRVLVNNQYYVRLNKSARSREDKQYIAECMQTANWLVKSLHQRATTILKVSAEIIRQQEGFFINGVHGLRPLILRDIAEAISMHESTVSRVTSNKFMATPRGIFELKYFFTHAVGGSRGGDIHSAESVRHHIKASDRGRKRRRCSLRRRACRAPSKGRYRHRAANCGQVSRSDGHPILGAASARKVRAAPLRRKGHGLTPFVATSIVPAFSDPSIDANMRVFYGLCLKVWDAFGTRTVTVRLSPGLRIP